MAYHGPNPGQASRRTYTRQQMEDSRTAWDAGEFSAEWRPWRHLAAMQAGIIAPPTGTKWDNWGDDEPSERAILIRAIRETPELLRRILTTQRVGAWSNVIALLVRERDHQVEHVGEVWRSDREERDAEATHQQAKDTLRRIGIVLGRQA